MLTQLNPPIPLDTPKGKALAHFVIDYGPEHNLMWVTFVDATGECWTWPNPKIRAQKNITMGRTPTSIQPTSIVDDNEAIAMPSIANGTGKNAH